MQPPMDATLDSPIQSLEEARVVIAQLREDFQHTVSALQSENRLLRQKLEAFVRRYFGGQQNEGIDPRQLELLMAGLEAALTPSRAVQQKKAPDRSVSASRPVRQALPAHLETERVVLEPPEVVEQPEGWRKLGEETTEELDWKPAQFIKRVYVRPKYVKADRIVMAPLPARLIEKGLPGAGLLTQVIVSKYEDHLPLYRQEKIYRERHGVNLSRQTMCGWVEAAAEWLLPIYRQMKAGMLAGDYLQADETSIRYLDPDVKGRSQRGFLWTYGPPKGDVVFEWKVSRSREGPREFLQTFRGKLQTDGYGAYESLARAREDWVLVGCWAHVRRGFHEALAEGGTVAWFVGQIGLLYGVERRLREAQAGAALRAAVRQSESRPVLERLHRAMSVVRRRVLPKSLLGQALDYALARWAGLTRYVEDGRLEIDNNRCENAIRPTAIGKKNFLFIGHPEAGQRSAVIYSILGSCRRHGLDPAEYLREVFERLPKATTSEVASLTPSAWAKARRARKAASVAREIPGARRLPAA